MLSAEKLSAQLEATKRQIEEITTEAACNEDKMRRSQRRELGLLQAEDLQALFHELTAGLRASYGLQYVSVVLCDPDYDIRHLLLAAGSPAQDIEDVIMVESMTGLAPQYVALRKPWLGPYAGCDHQLVFPACRGARLRKRCYVMTAWQVFHDAKPLDRLMYRQHGCFSVSPEPNKITIPGEAAVWGYGGGALPDTGGPCSDCSCRTRRRRGS